MDSQVILKYPFVFLVGFLCAYLLTPVIRRLAPGLGMLDMPAARRIHKLPIARGGGIAVFLAFHLACAAVFLFPWASFDSYLTPLWWWHFLLLSTFLLAIGIVDDARGMNARLKLLGQVVTGLLAFLFDMRMEKMLGLDLPLGVDLVLTVFWFVAIINAFNLIDGLDGVACGLAAVAAMGLGGWLLFRHQPGDALVLLGFIGVCFAFLRYNYHPASIFLGDSGSMFLGFTLANIALCTGSKAAAVPAIAVPLLALGIPIFDVVLAVWRRSVRRLLGRLNNVSDDVKGRVFAPDMDHLHHRLVKAGMSQRATAVSLYAAAFVLVSIGLVSAIWRDQALGIYVLAFLLGSYVIVRHLARTELWVSGRLIVKGIGEPGSRRLAIICRPPLDVFALCLALALATYLCSPAVSVKEWKLFWFDQIPLWGGIPFVVIILSRTYSRLWSRARISEYVLLAVALAAGITAAAAVAVMTNHFTPPVGTFVVNVGDASSTTVVMGFAVHHALAIQAVIYTGTALMLVVGLRALPIAVQDSMVWRRAPGLGDRDMARHVLVYGTGPECTLFLFQESLRTVDRPEYHQVCGILCDDPRLLGRIIHGYRVLSGTDNLSELIRNRHIEEIVLTREPDDEALRHLQEAVSSTGIALMRWRVVAEPNEPPHAPQVTGVSASSGVPQQ